MYNISVSCAEIQTAVGFVYLILPVILNQTNNPDCEQSWFSEDGLIADPSDPQRLSDPVISVSSDRLVTSRCVNLNHQIICDSADGCYHHHPSRAVMYNISVSCAEIQTAVGFVYVTLPVILNQTNNPDCEQSWFSEDGRLIADPSDPLRLIDPVISVSSDRLVTSRCVNLNHEIICDSADGSHFSCEIMFRVRNETAVTPNSDDLNEVTLQHSDQWLWILAVIAIVILLLLLIIIIFICFLWRKKKLRCFQNVFQCVSSENEDRDPETGV
ncbi:hypothetical protein Q8A67_001491 [Cirrhinus molitorella]|uniref:Uncharacterized protein n=1 Tax=Cirrhinus molitorella TaxID=172907 RepID=A0AA88QEF6_9TELE|nr:hypothetical protein Q8A67_001491 [Cirrhinus molitorella]